MKKVVIVKASEVDVHPFCIDEFIQHKEMPTTMNYVTKKELKQLAQKLGLNYDEKGIALSKKLLNAYLGKR